MTTKAFHPSSTDWNLIRAFLAVVEHGSLTQAANALGLSQPTLSRQIAELEAAIGAALFERVARGLQMTALGESLVEPAQSMMTAARSFSFVTAAQEESLAGTVRITASEVVAAFVLPNILVKLAQRHPEIQIELVASNQISNLLEREADIALRMVRPTQSALIARHLGDWPVGFYVHRDYVKNFGAPLPEQMSELSAYRWIGLDQSEQYIAGFRAAGWNIDKHFFSLRSDNHLVTWQMLKAGMGVGIAMRWLADQHNDLIAVMPKQKVPDLPMWLTSHRELKGNKRLRTVFDFLAEELKALNP